MKHDMVRIPARLTGLLALALLLVSCGGAKRECVWKDAGPGDWPQWGGTVQCNMVSDQKGLPPSLVPGKPVKGGGTTLDMSEARNVKWVVPLGKQTYGTPTVAGGRIFIGTTCPDADQRYQGDRGSLMCFEEATGKLLWQLNVPREERNKTLAKGLGITSAASIEGKRAYALGYGGDVLCVDVCGQADGNDGPFTDEQAYIGVPGRFRLRDTDGDIVWRYSVIEELGIQPHNAYAFAPLVYGKYIYVSSGNGVNMLHKVSDTPDAPSLLVLDKITGTLVAYDEERIGTRVYHGQWASPSIGTVNGSPQLLFGGGDGICYAFEPEPEPGDGVKPGVLKKIWSFDANAHCRDRSYKSRDGPSEILASPVCYSNRVYITTGQDWTHHHGTGVLACIDATKTGDITETGRIWQYFGLGRSMATVSVAGGLVYATDVNGHIHCVDAETGELRWMRDVDNPIWDSTLVADGKVYVGDCTGKFHVFAAGAEEKLLSMCDFDERMCGAPVAANGVLYVATFKHLYAIAETGR